MSAWSEVEQSTNHKMEGVVEMVAMRESSSQAVAKAHAGYRRVEHVGHRKARERSQR